MYFLLDTVIVLIIILFIIFGSKKGFARTLIEVVGYIAAVVIAFNVAGFASEYVYENNLKPSIVSSITNSAGETIKSTGNSIDEIWESLPSYITSLSGIAGFDKNTLGEAIDNTVIGNVEKSVEDTAETVTDTVIKPIVVSALKFILAFVLVILLLAVVKLLARVVGKAFNIPGLRGINRFLGGIAGGVKGIIIVYILVGLISFCMPLFGNKIGFITPDIINESYLFNMFYNINII